MEWWEPTDHQVFVAVEHFGNIVWICLLAPRAFVDVVIWDVVSITKSHHAHEVDSVIPKLGCDCSFPWP